VHLHRWIGAIRHRLFTGYKRIRFRMRTTVPSLLHGQETIHSQGSGENAGDLRLSAEQSAGCCLFTSFHSIDIVSGRMGRLAVLAT